jgi:hypothetical protein
MCVSRRTERDRYPGLPQHWPGSGRPLSQPDRIPDEMSVAAATLGLWLISRDSRFTDEGWHPWRPTPDWDGWQEHPTFIDGLANAGSVILGVPVGDGEQTLHVVRAADGRQGSQQAIRGLQLGSSRSVRRSPLSSGSTVA